MEQDAYEKLARALDLLPGGFPPTRSRVELQILRRIFSPEEALVAGNMTGTFETADVIAGRIDRPKTEIEEKLVKMQGRGVIRGIRVGEIQKFRLVPYVVGLYEQQWEVMDPELAHLCEHYWNDGGLAGIMRYDPALHRVVPVQRALKTDFILPYDDIRPMITAAKSFELRDCVCRKQQELIGNRKCSFPLRVCLNFSPIERPSGPHSITRAEALKVLDDAEDVGLVHTVSNVAKGVFYVCNCCGCCCTCLRGITQFGIENSIAKANYYSVVDPGRCNGCGICVDRCQVNACSVNDVATIDRAKCIGCGLCVTGCPAEAITLKRKPDAEIIPPPDDFNAWEQLRLRNRGLLK